MRETREEWPINEDGGSTLSLWPHTLQISQLLEGGGGGVDKDLFKYLSFTGHSYNKCS